MLKTYTLYLRAGAEGADTFEPVLCRSSGEAVTRALDLLEHHPQYIAVDVFFGDSELFRVKRPKA